jgi:hypothetical protein
LGLGIMAIDSIFILNLYTISDKRSISDEGVIRIEKILTPNITAQLKVGK